MISTIRMWGKDLVVRIPRRFAADIGLHAGARVDVVVESGALVVRPSSPRRPALARLLNDVTSGNRHPATDWRERTGQEGW